MSPELIAWLTRPDHEPVAQWEAEPRVELLHCHPDLIARLSEVARPIRGTARVFVSGCPVVHHRCGRPIAAASGTDTLVVRSDRPPGGLAAAEVPELGDEWCALDPWSVGVAFASGTDLLRGHVARAYELAEAA